MLVISLKQVMFQFFEKENKKIKIVRIIHWCLTVSGIIHMLIMLHIDHIKIVKNVSI